MNFLERAELLISRGIPVIPVLPKTKQAFIRNWPEAATTQRDKIREWNRRNPQCNTGAVAKLDGIVVLDVDDPQVYEHLRAAGIDLASIRTFKVMGKKVSPCGHYYFHHTGASRAIGNCDQRLVSRSTGKKLSTLFDLKSHNAYVVGPGSRHPDGPTYTVVDDSQIVTMPDELATWLAEHRGEIQVEDDGQWATTQAVPRASKSDGARAGTLEARVEAVLEKCRGLRARKDGPDYERIKAVLAEFGYAHRHEFDAALAEYLVSKYPSEQDLQEREFAALKLHQDRGGGYDTLTLKKAREKVARDIVEPKQVEPAAHADMPFAVLDGRLGEVCTRRLADLPIAYAWLALVTAAGALLPRNENGSTSDLRSNLFFCAVGEKGTGKSQAITRAASVLGLPSDILVESKFGSAEGLLLFLDEQKRDRCLLAVDELGYLLSKAAILGASLPYVLNTSFYQDRQVGGTKTQKFNIDCRLSIAGGLLEDQFGDSFGLATAGGLYDRFLYGLCPSSWQYLYRPFSGSPEELKPTKPAISGAVWDERDHWVRNGVPPRTAELGLRTAYICAAFDRREKLEGSDLRPAAALVGYQMLVRAGLVPNLGETLDARCAAKVRAWLAQYGGKGEWLSRRALHKGIHAERFGPSAFNRCLLSLQFAGEIELDKSGRNVRLLCD